MLDSTLTSSNYDRTRNILPYQDSLILINTNTDIATDNLYPEGFAVIFNPNDGNLEIKKAPQLDFKYKYWNQLQLNNGDRLFFLSDVGWSDTVKSGYYLTNLNFDSLTFRKQISFQDSLNVFCYTGIQVDNALYITGWVRTSQARIDIYLAKLDTSSLEIYWERTYGLPNRYEYPNSIQLINNNLFISAAANEGSGVSSSGYNLLLDTAGNILWEKYYEAGRINQRFVSGHFTQKGIVSFGSIRYPHPIYPNDPQQGQSGIWVCLTDSNGNNQQNKFYDLGPWNDYFENCFQDNDGNFICIGGTNNVPQQHQAGLMVKFSPLGDTLFTRVFDRSFNKSGYIDNITTGFQGSDGYYVLGGFTASGFVDGNQDIWILITDTNGCVQNYECRGVVTNLYDSNNSFIGELYPNPANNKTILKTNLDAKSTIRIHNTLGGIVYSNSIELGLQETEISLGSFSKGIYVITISYNSNIISKKLIVE